MSARDEAAGGVELLPCPSCKSRNLFCGPTAIGNPTLHVRCYQCGMEGPFAAWNRRTPSPRDQACSAMLGALEKIRRTPSMPFPDPGAHSERAFGNAVHRAWREIQSIAKEAASAARSAGIEPGEGG